MSILKYKKYFAREKRTAILKRVKQAGATKVATEHGISVRIINQWLRAARMMSEMAEQAAEATETAVTNTEMVEQQPQVTAEQKEQHQGKIGSRKFSIEERQAIIKRGEKVGFAQAAREAGIKPRTLYQWAFQLRHGGMPEQRKGSRAFTKEERLAIIRQGEEIGYAQAAEKAGVSVTALYQWRNYFRRNGYAAQTEVSSALQPNEETQPRIEEITDASIEAIPESNVERNTEKNVELVNDEALYTAKPKKRAKAGTPKEPTKSEKQAKPSEIPDKSNFDTVYALKIENAVLKEKVEFLSRRIESLREALQKLIN